MTMPNYPHIFEGTYLTCSYKKRGDENIPVNMLSWGPCLMTRVLKHFQKSEGGPLSVKTNWLNDATALALFLINNLLWIYNCIIGEDSLLILGEQVDFIFVVPTDFRRLLFLGMASSLKSQR